MTVVKGDNSFIDRMSEEQLTTLEGALNELVAMYPTLRWCPNVAQERPLGDLRGEGPYPFIQILTFGNGAGKTDVLACDIAGVMLGVDFLNDGWYQDEGGKWVGGQDLTFYRRFDDLRDSGNLRCRLVCDASDMDENGSIYEAIKRLIPTAEFVKGRGGREVRKLRVPHPTKPDISNVIDIKTFAQDTTAMAGSNLHRIWINEPCSYPVFSENVRRTRSKTGELPGSIMMAATVLDKAVWIFRLASDETMNKHGRVILYRGASWENCSGEELTDDIAATYREKMGFELKKNGAGGYVTRGVLSRASIEQMIHTLETEYPDEVDAFVWGANVLLQGAIYKSFSLAVHKVPRLTIGVNKRYPVFHVVDPHPVKNDAALWAYLNPMGRLKVFHETPHDPYENMRGRTITITEQCVQWDGVEELLGVSSQIAMRIGDPNRMNSKDSRDNRPLWSLYSDEGYNFTCNHDIVNDSLDLGHKLVQKWLWYDKIQYQRDPHDLRNQPLLSITDNCRNCLVSIQHYATKVVSDPTKPVSQVIDEKYKDFCDLIRYLVVVVSTRSYGEWLEYSRGSNNLNSDYERYKRGADPFAVKPENRQDHFPAEDDGDDGDGVGSDYERYRVAAGVA